MPRRKTQEEAIVDFKKVHGDRYGYNGVVYTGVRNKVEIYCYKHKILFKQTPRSHLAGKGCPQCGIESRRNTPEELIKVFRKVHGYRYTYPNLKDNYTRLIDKIIINCDKHGNFRQYVSSHRNGNGCPQCAIENRRSSIDEILSKFKKIHGNRYSYPYIEKEFVSIDKKITMVCDEHGIFKQRPIQHYGNKNGCPDCAKDRIGWTYTKWEEQAKKSNYFESFKLYIIELSNGLYKVGKTFRSLDDRAEEFPYNYKVIEVIILKNAR